jgi:hypothetical protein
MARRWPVRGALATCKGNAGRGGLGSVLAGFGLGVGALWVGVCETTPIDIVQRAEGNRGGGGPGVFFLFSSMSHGLGRGRGGWARQPGEGGSPQA